MKKIGPICRCLLALTAIFHLNCWTTLAASPSVGNEAFGGGPDLCVVQTPLITRHFQAWHRSQEAVPTRGCFNRLESASVAAATATYEVHVIRLTNAGNAMTLEVDGTGRPANTRLALILDADAAVKWNVRLVGKDPEPNPMANHVIVVTGNSVLDVCDFKASVTNRPKENRNSLLRFAERRFKAVHSFSQVEASGGQLAITLTLNPSIQSKNGSAWMTGCDYETANSSPVVEARRLEPQSVEGCFHAEQAGIYPKDVHVIELDNGQPDSNNKLNKVHIHLASGGSSRSKLSSRSEPESEDETNLNHPRHVALVLKSTRPVEWIVSSAPVLIGSLVIVTDSDTKSANRVDTSGLSARQQADLRLANDQTLPSAFEMLIVWVTADLGPPVSYVKVPSATNSVEIVIGKKQLSFLSSNGSKYQQQQVESLSGAASHSLPSMELGVRSLERGGVSNSGTAGGGGYQHTPNRAGTQRSVAWTLQQSVRVQCGSNYLTAALPLPMAEALGVVGLFLNDRSCSGKRNTTHWMVKTQFTSCGSTSRIDGKLTTYSNAVHIQLGAIQHQQNDDEDFEGSGLDGYPSAARQVTIPIQCHSEPNFPISFGDKMDDDNVMDTVDLPVGQMDLYHMEIHRNKEWTVPVLSGAGNEASKAEVVFDETLHVRTWIDGVSYIQIVTEKCWVSNSSDSDQPARLLLIRNTCPADLSVQMRPATDQDESDVDGGLGGGFSFHVSKDYADMGQLYIHCKLGLCTNQPNKAQGNLKLCVDPSQYCSGRHVLKPFLDESVSTAQQILVRGPLRMVTKASISNQQKIGAQAESTTSPGSTANQNSGLAGTQVILVGVSTEVTVGIALASFVIGVGLTAILWCIHMRTDPYRRVMNRKSRSAKSRSNNRCQGVKCSPMIRARSLVDDRTSLQQQVAASPQQQQQQQLVPAGSTGQQSEHSLPPQPAQHQFTYDYDVSSSQSNSSGSQCSREDSSPTPNSQTPMNVANC